MGGKVKLLGPFHKMGPIEKHMNRAGEKTLPKGGKGEDWVMFDGERLYDDPSDPDIHAQFLRLTGRTEPVKKAFGGAIRRSVRAAAPQSTLEAVEQSAPTVPPASPAARRPMGRVAGRALGRMPLRKVLAGADSDIRANGQKLASAQARFAGGGKVSTVKPLLGRLKMLADKFEAALAANDQDSVVSIARQLDAAQPGLSKQLMNTNAEMGAAEKLPLYAKGGKVRKALKTISGPGTKADPDYHVAGGPGTRSDPEYDSATRKGKKPTNTKDHHTEVFRAVEDDGGDFDETANYTFSTKEIRDHIGDELEEAGLDRKLASKFKVKEHPSFLEFDSGNPSHAVGYFDTTVSGPADVVEALHKYLDSQD